MTMNFDPRAKDSTSWGGFAGRPGDANNPMQKSAAQADVDRYRTQGALAQQRQAYQNDWTQASASRAQQGDALGLARAAAMGQAPSAAQSLAQNQLDNSINSQMAMAASARGGSLAQAAAQRSAMMQGAQMQQQGVNQIGALRAQEMAQARDAYAQQAGAMRAGDMSQQGMNMQSELAQRQMNDAAQMGYERMGYGVNEAQLQADTARYQADLNYQNATNDRNLRRSEAATDRAWKLAGGVLGGIGGFFSDASAKVPLYGYGSVGPGLSAAVGYRDAKQLATTNNEAGGYAGDMFAGPIAPDTAKLAPGTSDWAKYGEPGAKDTKAALTGAPPAVGPAPDVAAGAPVDPMQARAGRGLSAFGSMLSDMTAKAPMMLSDMVGKVPMGYSDARSKMPTDVMGYEDGARIGEDGLGYVERPAAESVVPAKFAAMQAAKEERGGLAKAAATAKKGAGSGRKMTYDEMLAELEKTREPTLRALRTPSVLKAAVAESRSGDMADAARAMQASAYAYKPGMEPPEQAPGEPNVGPMAQNMAANPVTATAVKRDPNTGLLMIDQSKMTKVLGGVVADQQRQIDSLAALVAQRGR